MYFGMTEGELITPDGVFPPFTLMVAIKPNNVPAIEAVVKAIEPYLNKDQAIELVRILNTLADYHEEKGT